VTVKELKEILAGCKDEQEIRVEYRGHDTELYRNDCYDVDDCNLTDIAVYLEFR
jgi:hypothetical protein